ncbi:GIY-YIG nuclease family protein [Crateriforma spongiae]|uniref:GIY-YIG nuclease family protein n=1 Tax=Crateriforma spongiae TaxID=2724528 RepID=UPI0039B09608
MGKKKAAASFTDDDDALLAELGVETEVKQAQTYTPKQERIIAGFEDIQRFYREHGRRPQHGDVRDIFERLYAVRLDRIVADPECLELLRPLDEDGLLDARVSEEGEEYSIESDDELLEALGVGPSENDITTMKHVRTAAERNAPEEIAQRKPCEDFDDFRPDFEAVQADIESGQQTTELFKTSSRSQIKKGDWFIVDGHKALVADAGKWFTPEHGERDRRLRVIFDNGTESDLLLRSLRRALNKDEASRRIVPPQPETDDEYATAGPLFSNVFDTDDSESGTIYIARSLSDDEFVKANREVLHKIGVTGGDPVTRIAGAKKDPTYLLAEAELVATYKLANINRKALETLLHKFFAKARLDVALADRFGDKVRPREWFLVPLPVIAEVVDRVKDGSISDYRYDTDTATLRIR